MSPMSRKERAAAAWVGINRCDARFKCSEADHNAYNEETKREIRSALKKIKLTRNVDDDLDD
eukprot:3754789-Amphidinium_carterae.1